MKYVVDFEAWAYEKYRRFKKAQELDPNLACVVSPSSHTTVIINMKSGKTSFSKCHKCDTFHESTGLGVAWARYIGEEIPKEIKIINTSKLKYGQRFSFMNREGENIFVAKHPLNDSFIYSRLDDNIFAEWNQDVYLIQ